MKFDEKYKPVREKEENRNYLLRMDPFIRIKARKEDLNSYDDAKMFNSTVKLSKNVSKPVQKEIFKRTNSQFLIKKRTVLTTNK
jgi:hypothetical protein